jgi:hypothetical protein
VGFACGASGFLAGFALGEAVGGVAGLDDAAMVRDAIKQRSGHLGVELCPKVGDDHLQAAV